MIQLLSESSRSACYLITEPASDDKLLMKVNTHSRLSKSELRNEFNFCQKLSIPNIRKSVKSGFFQNKEAYYYEFFEGITLKKFLSERVLNESEFYKIAINIVQTVAQIHSKNVIHLRINSNNILINPKDLNTCLIDFSLSSLSTEPKPIHFEEWASELAFMAPEQSGHLNKKIDSRSDLYALGIVLYKIWTGRTPFIGEHAADMVHNHLVASVPDLNQWRKDSPIAIQKIIEKLLRKNPEARYQSSNGLLADLNICLENLMNGNSDHGFQPGTKDLNTSLGISTGFYERDQELNFLKKKFQETRLNQGDGKFILISGANGTGKTRLAEEFSKFATEDGGIFIPIRYTGQDTFIPNQTLIETLKGLATFILSRADENLETWKRRLLEAIGDIGQLLIDLVPEYHWIIGDQPPLARLNANQAERRLNFLYYRVLSSLSSQEHPLVLFIDDMQWMETASWNQLGQIIKGTRIPHLLLIGAYTKSQTENQNDFDAHSSQAFDENTQTTELNLDNFQPETVLSLIQDSFEMDNIQGLTDLIYRKTRGNPFYIRKFLEGIYQNKLLVFNQDQQKWMYDSDQIRQSEWADNVIIYLTHLVNSLEPVTLKILGMASCFGLRWKKQDLIAIAEMDNEAIEQAISKLSELDLIHIAADDEYEFEHESILKTAYEGLESSVRSHYHNQIAHYWLKSLENPEHSSNLFQIVNQFNRCKELIQEEDRYQVLKLNFLAGLNAKNTTDYELSFAYFKNAIDWIRDADNINHSELIINLYREAAESGMKTAQYEDANHFLTKSIALSQNIEDKVAAYEIKLTHYCETHQFPNAIDYLLQILETLGYHIKRNPNKIKILKEFVTVKLLFLGKSAEDITNLKEIQDPKAHAFIKLTTMATVAIFGSAPDILPIVNFKQISLSLQYGKSPYLPYALAAYGFAITVFMNDFVNGHKLAQTALKMTEKPEAKIIRAKVMVIYYGFLSYWKNAIIESKNPLKEAYWIGRQTGDLLYASFALSFHLEIRYYSGENLLDLFEEQTESNRIIKNLKQELVYIISEYQRQMIINLIQDQNVPWILQNEGFNEEKAIEELKNLGDQASTFGLYYNKMFLACLFNAYSEAEEFRKTAAHYEDEATSRQINYPSYLLYSTIIEIKNLSKYHNVHLVKPLRNIKRKIKLLKSHAVHAPQNYKNKYILLEALLYEHENKSTEALTHFIQAIDLSREAGFLAEEALSRELLAYYLLKSGQKEFGEMMLNLAYLSYRNWGARSKCNQLAELYPSILSNQAELGFENTIASFQNIFDLSTIIKANQILSSENNLQGLLTRMLEQVMKNASCTKAVIVLKDSTGQLLPFAEGNQDSISMLDTHTGQMNQIVPFSLVMYCAHSKSEYVSDHLSQDKMYSQDSYVQSHKPVSCCIIPIVSNNSFLGVLYLENNLVESAFDRKRIEFFKTITAQLAISIENVNLYTEMEAKVIDRTAQIQMKNQELTVEKDKSDKLLLNILPEKIATELKENGYSVAKKYERATILFTDIKNFTLISEKMEPEELVSELDTYFKKFDEISTEYGLEKIKTVGDAYLAVGGLPDDNSANAIDVVAAAIQMIEFTKQRVQERRLQGKPGFEIRVGINTGPVVSGIVGFKKFQFDIWGYAVNVAARMEQNSETGRINVSASTYDLIKHHYQCEYRGKMPAKGLGDIEMYFVNGLV